MNDDTRASQDARRAFAAASLVGRDEVFDTLARVADILAAPDQGETLWRVYQAVVEVEGWWGKLA